MVIRVGKFVHLLGLMPVCTGLHKVSKHGIFLAIRYVYVILHCFVTFLDTIWVNNEFSLVKLLKTLAYSKWLSKLKLALAL